MNDLSVELNPYLIPEINARTITGRILLHGLVNYGTNDVFIVSLQ